MTIRRGGMLTFTQILYKVLVLSISGLVLQYTVEANPPLFTQLYL